MRCFAQKVSGVALLDVRARCRQQRGLQLSTRAFLRGANYARKSRRTDDCEAGRREEKEFITILDEIIIEELNISALCSYLICVRVLDDISINCNTCRGSMAPKRKLLRGLLRPPQPQLRTSSYTQKPASKNEVSVRTEKEPDIPGKCIHLHVCVLTNSSRVIEFSFQPSKPFLDPSIVERRIQAEKQWKVAQDKKRKEEPGPSQGA